MLPSADADLVRRLPHVPALGDLLDPGRLVLLVRSLVPEGAVPPERVVAERVLLGPNGATAALVLTGPDGEHRAGLRAGPAGAPPVAAPEEDGGPPLARPAAPAGWTSPVVDERLGTVLTAPAHDPAVAGVRRVAADPSAYAGRRAHRLTAVRYVPGGHWTGRAEDAEGAPLAAVRVRVGGVNVAAHVALAAAGVPVPELLRVNRFGVLAVAWLEGAPFSVEGAQEVGALLGRVHAVPPPRELPAQAPPPGPVSTARHLARLLPDAADRALALARACEARDADGGPPVLTLGAPRPGGVVLTPHGAAPVHPGAVRSGRPADDLASLAAAWTAAAPGARGPGAVLAPLLAGYRSTASAEAADRVRRDLPRASAAALLHAARLPFEHRLPDWPEATRLLLSAAAAAPAVDA
ncbi:hypothetical protein [Nocardiopsis trehalosi]|uniref:hypothetical protein n=1 Tax=Nocardiopsis trehalosi TaxID=109329 RepID=UPI00082A70A9|nr:hypothetical protein [Nocardiopsis trehalosi]